MKIISLILAAGVGSRTGLSIPKQYYEFEGQSILLRAIRPFLSHKLIDNVQVVIHPEHFDLYNSAMSETKLLPPVFGAEDRQGSSLIGLQAIRKLQPTHVLIHDAARPFVSPELIDRVISELSNSDACVPALPITETIKKVKDGIVLETLDRERLKSIQTPQGFAFKTILNAHLANRNLNFNDDASIAELSGINVAIVAGSHKNIKITNDSDVSDIQNRSTEKQSGEVRVGNGYDVHRFQTGDHLMLCGVKIPFNKGLSGHSDADVALHAITDAILGSAGAGDIGEYFPPEDPKWKNSPSEIFLIEANNIARKNRLKLVNIDLTIVCEEPKITPFKKVMLEYLSKVLEIDITRINIKGKTSEGLGFVGRKEGIAAFAVVNAQKY